MDATWESSLAVSHSGALARMGVAMEPEGEFDLVTLTEALECLQPHLHPFEAAEWLNLAHRTGKIVLLTKWGPILPDTNPGALGIAACRLPTGDYVLYVQVRRAFAGCGLIWGPSDPVDLLDQHHRSWAFDGKSFHESVEEYFSAAPHDSSENHPTDPKDRGGRPQKYDRDEILIEAAMAVFEDGLPEPLTLERFANMVMARLGDHSPKDTQLKNILRPLYQRLKAASER